MTKKRRAIAVTACSLVACAAIGLGIYWGLGSADNSPELNVGLVHSENGHYYYDSMGEMQFGFHIIEGKLYYFDPGTGAAITGWFTAADGSNYYFGTDGAAWTGKQTIDGKAYEFDANGRLLPDAQTAGYVWKIVDGKHYCIGPDGEFVYGLQEIAGSLYYFDDSGVRQSGWMELDGRRYYFGENGRAARGWLNISEGTYYFGADGYAVTGTQAIDGQSYTFDANGRLIVESNTTPNATPPTTAAPPAVQTPEATPPPAAEEPMASGTWEKDDSGETKYKLPEGGYAVGAQYIDSKYYLFNDAGVMQKGWTTYAGQLYYMDASTGEALTGWQQNADTGKQYYMNRNGAALANIQLFSDGNRYYFDPETYEQLTGLQLVDGKLYYFAGTKGEALTGWYTIETEPVARMSTMAFQMAETEAPQGSTYYFCPDHYALTGLQNIGGKWYAFTDSGVQMFGWQDIGGEDGVGGKRFCFGGTGGSALVDQFIEREEGFVYLGPDGYALSGLVTTAQGAFYMNDNGVRQNGWYTVDGKLYSFTGADDAALLNTWSDGEHGRSYLGEDGAAYTGPRVVSGVLYGFGSNGALVSGFREYDGNYYFFNEQGAAQYGWQEHAGQHYYVGENGNALKGLQAIEGEGVFFFDTSNAQREGGWKNINGKSYLFNGDNQQARIGEWTDDKTGLVYLFGSDGAACTGAHKVGEVWYFYDKNGVRVNGWQADADGNRYYCDTETFAALHGWFTDASSGGIYFFGEDAKAVTGQQVLGEQTYQFGTDGRLKYDPEEDAKNWLVVGGETYYMGPEGAYLTGLQSIGGARYYFASSGAQRYGWQQIQNRWYYFDKENGGKARTGWFTDADGKTYYLGDDGAAYTNVMKIQDDWYCFDTRGVQRVGKLQLDGKWYYFDKENGGKAHTGWYPAKSSEEPVYYFDKEYAVATVGVKSIGGELYWFNDAGVRQSGWYTDENGHKMYFGATDFAAWKGEYTPDDNSFYHFDDTGRAYVGLVKLEEGGPLYYFDETGLRYTGWLRYGGERYLFAANGQAVYGWYLDAETGNEYYFSEHGTALTGDHEWGGGTYKFDQDGKLLWRKATVGYQWVSGEDGKQYYLDSLGGHPTGFFNVDGFRYYFDSNGAAVTGWLPLNGSLYCFADDGKIILGWHTQLVKNGEAEVLQAFYFASEGNALTGKQTINEIEYEFDTNGVLVKGTVPVYNKWDEVDGEWVYYDSTGRLATGVVLIDGAWYCFSDAGIRQTGRVQVETGFYYFDPETAQGRPGWVEIEGRWYYFDSNSCKQILEWNYRTDENGTKYAYYHDPATGHPLVGFAEVGGVTRYFLEDGHLASGWETIDGKVYYFLQSGEYATGVVTVEGKLCSFDQDGVQTNGWNKDATGKRYYFADNAAVSGWNLIEDRYYYFSKDTNIQLTGWQYRPAEDGSTHSFFYNGDGSLPDAGWGTISNIYRYIFPDGHMATGWQLLDGYLYYFSNTGSLSKGITNIDDVDYPFDDEGRLPEGWYQQAGDAPRYHFTLQGALRGWQEVEDVWYLFDEDSAQQQTGWQTRTVDGKTYRHYFDKAGESPADEWTTFDNTRRYFHADGSMAEGWTTVGAGETTYYFIPGTGRMATGALTIDGVRYSFGADGQLVLGWNSDEDGNRYYFTENGALKGWQPIGDVLYCFDDNGVQQLGWQTRTESGKTLHHFFFANGDAPAAGWNTAIDGARRYVLANGQLAQGWTDVAGKSLFFDNQGQQIIGWAEVDGRWYNFAEAGGQLTGWQERKLDSGAVAVYFYFADGSLPTAGWSTQVEGVRRYVRADGSLALGFEVIDGHTYYFDHGGLPRTGSHVIDGKTYVFDSTGRYVMPPVIEKVEYETGWAAKKLVTVTAKANAPMTQADLEYSFNGSAWQKSNTFSAAGGTYFAVGSIKVRDAAGNVASYTKEAIQIDAASTNLHGIDVSSYQGYINWGQVKNSGEVQFAIIRSLTWDGKANGGKGYYVIDPYFETNVRNAKANGILVGTYLYSYAFNKTEMKEEIDFFMNSAEVNNLLRDGIYFDLPVFIDYEDPHIINNTPNMTKEQRTDQLRYGMNLINELSGGKFVGGFYTYKYFAETYLNATQLQNEKATNGKDFEFWLAYHGVTNHNWSPAPPIWQYNNGTYFNDKGVAGILVNVDKNYMFKDYTSVISGGKAPSTEVAYQLTVYDQNTRKTVTANAVDILSQIVMAEVGGFNNAEVYKAQAVAAHSWLRYQYSQKVTAPQVALKAPTAAVRAAVSEVLNQTLTYNGEVALTPYYAYSNGYTNDVKYWNASNNSMPYLTSVAVSYDNNKAATTRSITQEALRQRIISIYSSIDPGIAQRLDSTAPQDWIKIVSTNSAGYVTAVSVCGRTPTIDYFYQTLLPNTSSGLRPVLSPSFSVSYANGTFTFTSRGSGHGIGMSQTGVFGLATQGYTYKQILAHFYPGTTLTG